MKNVDISGDIVVQYIYTLGAAGERKSVTELDRTVEYSYDSLYRLTSETITEGEKVTAYTYAYDNVSNRTLKTENGAATEYVYNALNQLVSDSETTYEYDLNGNLIRVIDSAQSALYEYNSENKLVRNTVQNGVLVTEESYTYDCQGNRTSKTTHRSDGVTEYVKYLNIAASSLTRLRGCITYVPVIWILLRVGLFRRIAMREVFLNLFHCTNICMQTQILLCIAIQLDKNFWL